MQTITSQLAQRANQRLAWATAQMGPVGVPPLSLIIDLAHFQEGSVREGHGVNPHRHAFFQIQAALGGRFEFASDTNTILLEDGDACLIGPETSHRWLCLQSGVLFGMDFYGKRDDGPLESSFKFTGTQSILLASDPDLTRLLNELVRIATGPPNGWMREQTRFQLGLWITRLLPAFMHTEAAEESSSAPPDIDSRTDQQVRKIESFLRSNLTNPLLLADVAQEVGMSTRQLTRVFKRARNRTVHNWLMELRLREAHRRLASGQAESVKQTAYECGFSEPTHFSRCYREHFGHNPSEDLRSARRPDR